MSKAKTLDDALKGHDPDTMARQKIEAHFAAQRAIGPEEWDQEEDFCSKSKVSRKEILAYREIYKEHVVETPSIDGRAPRWLWFADPRIAARFRAKTKKSA